MPTFEEKLKRLEQLTADIKRNNISLEDALNDFEEGIKLARGMENEIDKIEIKWNNILPFPGYLAMTFFGKMWIRKSNKQKWQNYIKWGKSNIVLNHELIHVKQSISTNNSWWKFYLLYIWEWFKANPLFNGFKFAYKMNPFELEAYANENDLDYNIVNKNGAIQWKQFKTISIKQRKQLWKFFKENKSMTFNDFVNYHVMPLLNKKNNG